MEKPERRPWENLCTQPPERLPRITEPRPELPPARRSLWAKLVRRP